MFDSDYALPLRCWRWLRRWRHRRGYGVHSPFAFQFITGVLYETGEYYAYRDLGSRLTPANWYGMRRDAESGISEKDLRLLFRLANFCNPSWIVSYKISKTIADYLHTAVPSALMTERYIGVFYRDSLMPGMIVATDSHTFVAPLLAFAPGSMAVMFGIHRDWICENNWKSVKEARDVTLTFDLGRIGIALSVEKMTKQHYDVCYF